MKQTAVDWVFKYLWENHNLSFSDNVLAKAKEMEKEQIMLAHLMGFMDIDGKKTEEQYYNETYGVKE
jgi:hypothetical protein